MPELNSPMLFGGADILWSNSDIWPAATDQPAKAFCDNMGVDQFCTGAI
jgi:hypothetical protein